MELEWLLTTLYSSSLFNSHLLSFHFLTINSILPVTLLSMQSSNNRIQKKSMQVKHIVEKAKSGNQRAFKELFDQNVNSLYRYLRQFTKNKDEAEDWVQRAFIKAFNAINTFEGNSSFSTWLFRIGINEMRSDLRTRKETSELDKDIYDHSINSFEEFEWENEMKWILANLDELRKSVFLLHEVEGYSHSEISEMLNISDGQSRITLHRTKIILKEKYLAKERMTNDRS
jgi:RNA polymerase sigma-70 factor, ECF subfamily